MNFEVKKGDLLDQDVEVIVNPWNRNFFPWWLLWLQGVSGAIKKRGGLKPFRELPVGPIPLGSAVLTSAGNLSYKSIINVVAINGFWRSSPFSIRQSVISALDMAGVKTTTFLPPM